MSNGICIFANNNGLIDYTQQAMVCSAMLKSNLKENNVALITDQGSWDYIKNRYDNNLISYLFQEIVFLDYADLKDQLRVFRDGPYSNVTGNWRNNPRSKVYQLTPWKKTLLIDSDYLIQSSWLDYIWSSKDFLINTNAMNLLDNKEGLDVYIDGFSIPVNWATVCYFNKCSEHNDFFQLVEHIIDNLEYYQHSYNYSGNLFRNDFIFGIANFIMGGNKLESFAKSFPNPVLRTSVDRDDLLEPKEKNSLTFLANKSAEEHWIWNAILVKNQNVHVMNKHAIGRHAETLLKLHLPESLVQYV
jgi:hypothetical protein